MAIELADFNRFNKDYEYLVRMTGKDASRIELLVQNNPDMRRLVGRLYYWDIDFKGQRRTLSFVAGVPDWFGDHYGTYRNKFAPEVDRVYGRFDLLARFGESDEVDGIPAEEILHPGGRPPRSDQPGDFSAAFFLSAAEAVEFVMSWVNETHADRDIHEELREGLDAWDYLTETIGVDLDAIERRWQKLPRALIPRHVSDNSASGSGDPLLELLSNAINAYLFGAYAAAIVVCRAVCEKVLKEHYLDEREYRDADGRNEPLKQLIYLAEEKFEHLRKLRLDHFREFANRVVHDYGRVEGDEEDVVCDFLETAKTLIEGAPKPKTT